MGIRSWFRSRRERKQVRKIEAAAKTVLKALGSKALAQLVREGGWDVLASYSSSTSEAPWNSFTSANAEEMYEFLSVIYACAKKIADTAPNFPFAVVSYDADGEREYHEDHAMLNLVEHPNSEMNYAEFLYNVVLHLELTGVTYVWKSRNGAGYPDGLWPFPTSWVREVTDSEANVLRYVVEYGDYKETIRVEDMIVIRYPSPGNPLQPAGPAQACFRDAQIEEARMDYLIELLENMHLPGPVFKAKEAWTEEQMAIIRRMVRDKIGKGKRGSPLFLGGEGEPDLVMTNPLADMDWPGTAGLNETRICASFEVPPILIGLRSGLERSTFSNTSESKVSFYQNKMVTVTDKLAAGFSLGLLHAEGDVDFWFETVKDDIPELQEDEDKKHERARQDWLVGGLTLDEFLARIGSDEVGGRDGEMRLLPMGAQPWYPNEELPGPLGTEAGTEEEEEEGFVTDEEEEEEEEESEDEAGDEDEEEDETDEDTEEEEGEEEEE